MTWDAIQCYNVNTLLAEHLPANTPIDVLDIDIEGYDEKVLSVLDWEKYRPLIVLVETHTDGIDELITSHTYQLLTNARAPMFGHVPLNENPL